MFSPDRTAAQASFIVINNGVLSSYCSWSIVQDNAYHDQCFGSSPHASACARRTCCHRCVLCTRCVFDRLFTRQHIDVLSPRMTHLGHFVKRTRTVYWVLTLFICAYKASKFSYYCTQKGNLLHELEASLVCGHQITKYLKLSDFNFKCTQLGPIDRATKLKWLG